MKQLHILIIFTVILGSWNLDASAQNVNFPDAKFSCSRPQRIDSCGGSRYPTNKFGRTHVSAGFQS